jgi:hypothetical protein
MQECRDDLGASYRETATSSSTMKRWSHFLAPCASEMPRLFGLDYKDKMVSPRPILQLGRAAAAPVITSKAQTTRTAASNLLFSSRSSFTAL